MPGEPTHYPHLPNPECWQCYVPGLWSGLIEISKVQTLAKDRKHVRNLLRIKLDRERLPPNTMVYPYFTFAGALLRDRARDEGLGRVDRILGNLPRQT